MRWLLDVAPSVYLDTIIMTNFCKRFSKMLKIVIYLLLFIGEGITLKFILTTQHTIFEKFWSTSLNEI